FTATDGAPEALIGRLLTCLDPRDTAVPGAVERHLAPAATAAMRMSKAARKDYDTIAIGGPPPGGPPPRRSLLPPRGGEGRGLRINLACVAEGAAAAVELIVVADGGGEALAAKVDRYARFYGFTGRLVITPYPLDRGQALEAGAAHSQADALLFMAPGVLPRG